MNEDLKAKLKEKLGAAVTDEQLDEVAGGTYRENLEILNAMAQLDPNGVKAVFDEINKDGNKTKTRKIINDGIVDLIQKNFYDVDVIPSNDGLNWYSKSYSDITHGQMMQLINDKIKTTQDWEVIDKIL